MKSRSAETSSSARQSWELFAVSVLGLFLELTLIRWVTTEVRIFAYLQNTVLIVCFLGLGMGAYTCRRPFRLTTTLGFLAALIALIALPFTGRLVRGISEMLSYVGGYEIWIWADGQAKTRATVIVSIVVGLALTFLLTFLVFSIFVPLGRMLGRLLDDHPRPIWAYSVNVAGSLLGTWLAVALSAFHASPAIWFALCAVMSLTFLSARLRDRTLEVALLVLVVALGFAASRESRAVRSVWSPYQKLVLWTDDAYREVQSGVPGDYIITVNNYGYQALINLDPDHVRANPDRFRQDLNGYSQYDLPFRFHRAPKNVLLVGAGGGNDAAGALRRGAGTITAVDIDPVIIELGRQYHPEDPYGSSAVRVVNDDARSFFFRTGERYDVIAFGLLDSHTTLGMTNARLDHFVYTRESLEKARSLLADGGILVLSFEAQKPYIADRMARVLTEVFDRPPILFRVPFSSYGWGGILFVAGNLEMVERQIEGDPLLRDLLAAYQRLSPLRLPGTTKVASDDWPYIYLRSPGIPPLFFILAALVLAMFALGRRLARAPAAVLTRDPSALHFFFLGAAFLLLEVQNISKASVVLGSTWWVNAVIISAVLVMILLANLIAARSPGIPLAAVYPALLLVCVGLYFVDLSWFVSMPYLSRALVVGALTTLPMLFSGIVFIRSFAATPHKDVAFGANLLGAMAGGLLEPITFLTGIRFLLLVVAALYACSWVARPDVWPRVAAVFRRT